MKHVTLQKIVAHDFRYDPRNILRNRIIEELPFSILSKDATSIFLTERAELVPVNFRNS